MSLAISYLFLALAVLLGVTSNSFAKSAEGFTLLYPSIITAFTIVACMYALSMVMKNIHFMLLIVSGIQKKIFGIGQNQSRLV